MHWHAIRTVSNREKAVAQQLTEKGVENFAPQVTVTQIRHGRRVERRQALFRNYTFGKWQSDDPNTWHVVNDSRHVVGIIGGGTPTPIEPGVIEKWQKSAGDDVTDEELQKRLADIRRGYKVGDFVRLQKGRDDAMIGTVAWVDDTSQKTGIRVELLGRTPIIVRNQKDVESVDAPLNQQVRRRQRGGKRGTRARKQAFVNYVASAMQTSS